MTSLIRHPDWRAKYCMLRALAVVVEGLEAVRNLTQTLSCVELIGVQSMRESLDVIYKYGAFKL